MPQNHQIKSLFLLFILTLTFVSAAHHHHHHKSRHLHKHRHKHQLLIDSNELNEIREAFDDYRKITQHRDRVSEEAVNPNSLNDEEETAPAQNFPHHANSMQRHKRVHTTSRMTTSTTTSTTTLKSVDNYDEEYDDDDIDTNRRANDEAKGLGGQQSQGQKHGINPRSHQPTEDLKTGETLTDYKNANLGTREGVEKSFRQYSDTQKLENQNSPYSQYQKNLVRTKIDGLCRWPNKKAIKMPHNSFKRYSPSKYIIYQCSDDTSCCGHSDKTCVAKRSENVTLWFYVEIFNSPPIYESLTVLNHTECQCVNKTTFPPHRPHRTTTTWQNPSHRSYCNCPQDFVVFYHRNSRNCECKCDNVECRMRYEGKEFFSMKDRSCINNGSCTKPNCLTGVYDNALGRCGVRNDRNKRHYATAEHHFIS